MKHRVHNNPKHDGKPKGPERYYAVFYKLQGKSSAAANGRDIRVKEILEQVAEGDLRVVPWYKKGRNIKEAENSAYYTSRDGGPQMETTPRAVVCTLQGNKLIPTSLVTAGIKLGEKAPNLWAVEIWDNRWTASLVAPKRK
ncbi:MAG: hypothetical protein ABIF01_04545 [Candidatus Micrarchaeota archaeon]